MKLVYSLAFVVLAMTSSPALAQEPSGNNPPLRRYIAAFGGVADIGSETTPTFAGEFGESLTQNAQAYATFSYFDNVMTDQMRDNLIAAADYVEQITGVQRTFSGRDRGLALTAGGKYVFGTSVRPYVGAGAGGIEISRTITEATLGDVSQAFATRPGLGDGVVNAGST